MSELCPTKYKTAPVRFLEDMAANLISGIDWEMQVDCRPETRRQQEIVAMKKTEIEIEMSETVAYSSRSERLENFCPTCRCMTEMASTQVSAVLGQTSERELYRLVETGEVHFVETDRVLICLNSLPGYEQKKVTSEETTPQSGL
jgi:hypothetical protein